MLSQLCDTPESLILTQYVWYSRQFNADTICQYRTVNLMTTKFVWYSRQINAHINVRNSREFISHYICVLQQTV